MIKMIYRGRLLSLLVLLLGIGVLSSCKKDDVEKSDAVELLSFGPTGAMHGEQLIVIGNNLHKVTAIEMVGATVAAASFVEQTTEKITLVIPMEAEEGFVVLKTADGDIMSKTKINFEVPVTITSITAQARPGDNITIRGEYLNWIKEVIFANDLAETTFVSRSLTELVVKVPQNARTGTLFISTGGTEPLVLETIQPLVVTLPMITGLNPNPAVREENLTITGTNLDLTMGVMFKGLTAPITTFVSKTATQLVVKVPAAANKGIVTLVAYSGITTESTTSLLFVGDLPDLAPLAYEMYVDGLRNGWQNWGWGSTASFDNTENVRDGAASIKMNYTGPWGALKFANVTVATAGYNELTFSIFGTPGTGGKKINVAANGGAAYVVTIEEGKWIEYKLTKAQVGNPANISELMFQNQDWSGIVYIDHVGLR